MGGIRLPRCALTLVATLAATPTFAQSTAAAVANAPIYVRAEVTQTPLRVAAPGTVFRVIEESGDWLQVEFNDPQYGRRAGWVQRQLVRVGIDRLRPMDLSVASPAVRDGDVPANRSSRAAGASSSFPAFETAIGWSYLWVSGELFDDNVSSPLGWAVSVAGNVTPWLGVVGDVSGHYKSDVLDVEGFDLNTHAFLGGVRFAVRQSEAVVPYATFLLGVTRTAASLPLLDFDESTWDFTLQPGGGVDVGSPTLAARFEISWRRVFYEGEGSNQLRLMAGVVIRSGAQP